MEFARILTKTLLAGWLDDWMAGWHLGIWLTAWLMAIATNTICMGLNVGGAHLLPSAKQKFANPCAYKATRDTFIVFALLERSKRLVKRTSRNSIS